MIAILVRRVALMVLIGVVPISAMALVQNEDAGRPPFIVVLGIAQDGGYPQAGCRKSCCASAQGENKLTTRAMIASFISATPSQYWDICTDEE